MKISGFTMVRNADKYYFPIKESILSILPIVDEFIVALGDCDKDDHTKDQIESIQSDKVKIFDRQWSASDFEDGNIFAKETNFAFSQCSGDWCFYLQADEVVHENDLNNIVECCELCLNQTQVDGLLFNYHHFFGDYDHYLPFHGWYRNEIRIVRNTNAIFSYKDAQSFRKNNNKKLNVVSIPPHIYHYGWVRPPELMQSKKKEQDSMYHGAGKIEKEYRSRPAEFNYGALSNIPMFTGSHPKVMHDRIGAITWKHKLSYSQSVNLERPLLKHERLKYRLITKLENFLKSDRFSGGYSNWNKITFESPQQ